MYQLFNYLLSNYLVVTETSFMFHLEIYLCADDKVPLIVNTSLKHKLVFSLNCLTVEERLERNFHQCTKYNHILESMIFVGDI